METILSHRSHRGSLERGTGLLRLFSACFSLLLLWQERSRQRRHLAEMEHYLLKDMGLTQADVHREVGKSFWRG